MLDPAAVMEQLVAPATLRIELMGIVAVVVGTGVTEKKLRSEEVVVVLARDEVVRKVEAISGQ